MILFIKQSFFRVFLTLFTALSFSLNAQNTLEKPAEQKSQKTDVTPKLKVISSSKPKIAQKKIPAEPENDRIFRRDLILQINEIIKKIQYNYPVMSEDLTVEKQKDVLKSLVSALDHGMKYISAEELAVKHTVKKSEDSLPAIMMNSNKILYIRIDSFSQKTLNQLKKDCENSAKFSEKIIGIIIDLRDSQGNDDKSAVNAAALFLSKPSMEKLNLRSSLRQTLKQPAILLTGGKTKGASEIFTRIMIQAKRAISLGEKSAGVPFKKRELILSNGDYLLIPQIPERLGQILTSAVKPSIIFTPYPQLSYKKLKETPGSEKSDKCIQRAVELVLCLNALKK